MKIFGALLFCLSLLFSCGSPTTQKAKMADSAVTTTRPLSKGDKILAKAVKAHGGKLYDTAHYSFVFRNKKYTFQNDGANYAYTKTSEKDGVETVDHLNGKGFMRKVNGEIANLTEKQIKGATGGLNSVIYFATLPHKLQDPAVNKKYISETTIKGEDYHILEVTFDQEGGGQDHDDEYHYWINKKNNVIDYLAYNYQVNKGGVRFRSAFNSRNVDGIIFQDYVNYKAPVGTPLADLPKLFEKEELEELSVIATEEVINLNKQ